METKVALSTQVCLETPHQPVAVLPPSSAHSAGEGAVALSLMSFDGRLSY